MKERCRKGFTAFILAASVVGLLWVTDSQAQFPNRPITLICGWPAGGITDVTARALSDAASVVTA